LETGQIEDPLKILQVARKGNYMNTWKDSTYAVEYQIPEKKVPE
jgi:hypothetical protein